MEPIFEGGWLHQGLRAMHWDVENELVAVSILGDVTVDLAHARTLPPDILVKAYALGRDVDVLVADDTHIEVSGRPRNGHLTNDVPFLDVSRRTHLVRIQAHTGLGDVTVRVAKRDSTSAP
ncbi:MAG: hypothetical protein ABI232_04460 [Jatrophihabitantaceae bacterium]